MLDDVDGETGLEAGVPGVLRSVGRRLWCEFGIYLQKADI